MKKTLLFLICMISFAVSAQNYKYNFISHFNEEGITEPLDLKANNILVSVDLNIPENIIKLQIKGGGEEKSYTIHINGEAKKYDDGEFSGLQYSCHTYDGGFYEDITVTMLDNNEICVMFSYTTRVGMIFETYLE